MAKKYNPVKCRYCGRIIDRNTEVEGTEWVMRQKGWYYCAPCYDMWLAKKDIKTEATEQQWKDFAWDYLRHDIKMSPDFYMFDAQWKAFQKNKMTPKGIYFALRYFYDVKKGDKDKANGGIGIVSYVYKDATDYWVRKENEETGILAQIIEQQKLRREQEKINVHVAREAVKEDKKEKATKKAAADLDFIAGLEDEDE